MQSTNSSLKYTFGWYAAEYIIGMRPRRHWSKQRQIITLSCHRPTRMWLIEAVNLNTNPRMKKMTFIIAFSLAIQATAVKQIRKNEVLKFLGYDCNKPSKLNSYKKSEWCMPVKTPENPKGDKTEGTKITIIQKFGS